MQSADKYPLVIELQVSSVLGFKSMSMKGIQKKKGILKNVLAQIFHRDIQLLFTFVVHTTLLTPSNPSSKKNITFIPLSNEIAFEKGIIYYAI